jgi:hypothetical protein
MMVCKVSMCEELCSLISFFFTNTNHLKFPNYSHTSRLGKEAENNQGQGLGRTDVKVIFNFVATVCGIGTA